MWGLVVRLGFRVLGEQLRGFRVKLQDSVSGWQDASSLNGDWSVRLGWRVFWRLGLGLGVYDVALTPQVPAM